MIRNTDVKPPRRAYSSVLRDGQAEATRTRILEALIRTMASGVAGLSVPAVARKAEVSIPTIYRHFGSKQGLLDALNPYVIEKGGLTPKMPQTAEQLEPSVRGLFRNLDAMDLTLRAAMASELGNEARRAMMPMRLAMAREYVGRIGPDLSDAELARMANVTLILMSSSAFRAYKDYLGMGPDASATLVSWAIKTLIVGARRAKDVPP
jgi:AcrR family transcriptional regulator